MTNATLPDKAPATLGYPLPHGQRHIDITDVPHAFRDLNNPHPFLKIAACAGVGHISLAKHRETGDYALVIQDRWILVSRTEALSVEMIGCLPHLGTADTSDEDREAILAWILWSWFRLETTPLGELYHEDC